MPVTQDPKGGPKGRTWFILALIVAAVVLGLGVGSMLLHTPNLSQTPEIQPEDHAATH